MLLTTRNISPRGTQDSHADHLTNELRPGLFPRIAEGVENDVGDIFAGVATMFMFFPQQTNLRFLVFGPQRLSRFVLLFEGTVT